MMTTTENLNSHRGSQESIVFASIVVDTIHSSVQGKRLIG